MSEHPTGAGSSRGRAEQAAEVLYRRRSVDWISDSGIASDRRPGSTARRAAVEVARATLVARDGLTGDHSDDVCLLCEELADELTLEDDVRSNLMAAATLHDIGKVAVPETILQKPGPLNGPEWKLVRAHTPIGASILSAVPELRDVAQIVLHSHEQWDGSGYPDGLAGEEIPLASRIILCADAYHAIRSTRPYRRGRSARSALRELRAHAGTHFDPGVVEALERVVARLRKSPPELVPGVRAVQRSRRLMVLLLALGLTGTALAALGTRSLGPDGQASAKSAPAATCPGAGCLPVSHPFTRELVGRPPARRSRARPSTRHLKRKRHAHRRRAHVGSRPSVPRDRARTHAAHPSAPIRPPAVPRARRGLHRALAYGHQKRLANPHPPKAPPGRLKVRRRP